MLVHVVYSNIAFYVGFKCIKMIWYFIIWMLAIVVIYREEALLGNIMFTRMNYIY